MKLEIINETDEDLSELQEAIQQFFPYAQKRLKFDKPVDVKFVSDKENASSMLGKTAYYDHNKMLIVIYIDKRHPKDMLRSFSHELVHHAQNCRGEFDNLRPHGADYAQKDPHLRKLEGEAYLLGNGYLIRDWEDQTKKQIQQENKNMSTESKLFEGIVKLLEEIGLPVDKAIEEGKLPAGLKAYMDKKKGKKSDSEDDDDKDSDKKKEKKSSKKDGRPFGDKDGDGEPNVLDKDADDADVQEEGLDEMFNLSMDPSKHRAGPHGAGASAGARSRCAEKGGRMDYSKSGRGICIDKKTGQEISEDVDESHCGGKRDDKNVDEKHCGKRDLDEEITEENVEEVNESFRQKKDNLLFEKLKNRWCK